MGVFHNSQYAYLVLINKPPGDIGSSYMYEGYRVRLYLTQRLTVE